MLVTVDPKHLGAVFRLRRRPCFQASMLEDGLDVVTACAMESRFPLTWRGRKGRRMDPDAWVPGVKLVYFSRIQISILFQVRATRDKTP